jgi:hypothetical protein
MEVKPKSVKLVSFEEELLPSGRKLLHCIFENKYGSGFQCKWTAPWRDKGGEKGVERLFFKGLEVEEWNDFDGVWSEELRKVAKEVPSLEEIVLPVKIEIGGITEAVEVVKTDSGEVRLESLRIGVNILSGEESVVRDIGSGEEYIKVGSVSMAWELLTSELHGLKRVDSVSDGIRSVTVWVPDGSGSYVEDVGGVSFGVVIYRTVNRSEYKVISREIASCIRRFIRVRLSEYKAIKRGFEED